MRFRREIIPGHALNLAELAEQQDFMCHRFILNPNVSEVPKASSALCSIGRLSVWLPRKLRSVREMDQEISGMCPRICLR